MSRMLYVALSILSSATLLPQANAAVSFTALPEKASPVRFSKACTPGERIVVSAVGDILPHGDLAKQAYASPIGFESLWTKIASYIKAADIAYGNLEGPTAPGIAKGGRRQPDPGPRLDNNVYTGSNFTFNYHPRIISDLQNVGFDIMSLANNHSFDRRSIGLDLTIDEFNSRGMPFVGARKAGDTTSPLYTMTSAKGVNIAWISCTEATNGIPDPHHQVLKCFSDADVIEKEIRQLVSDRRVDTIIVTPHWGSEYDFTANTKHRQLAARFMNAGADAIIGSHPHVLQEVEKFTTQDGRETLVAYSLGNFTSGQFWDWGRLTALLYIGFTKPPGQRAIVNGMIYLPLWMEKGPKTINALETTNQAPKEKAYNAIRRLMDPSRELKVGRPILTNFECYRNQ